MDRSPSLSAQLSGLEPARIPREQIPGLLCQLAALQTALSARLVQAQEESEGDHGSEDRLLNAEEAAEKLHVSPDWLYRRTRKLPFVVRLGTKHVRFSAQGIDRYLRNRQGR